MDDKTKKAVLPQSVADLVLAGRPVIYGMMHKGTAGEFPKARGGTYRKGTYSVITDTGAVTVNEYLPDGMEVAKWVQPFPPGTMVVILIRTQEDNGGAILVSGKCIEAK